MKHVNIKTLCQNNYKTTSERTKTHIRTLRLRLHLHSLPACFYDCFCCGSVLLSSVLLDGCSGRDATLRLECKPTSNAVGGETSLRYLFSLYISQKAVLFKKQVNRSVSDQRIVTHTSNTPSRGLLLLLSAYTQRRLESRRAPMLPCTSPGPSPRPGT